MSDILNIPTGNIEELKTNSLYLEGQPISDAILPKLVHRVSLSPEMNQDGQLEKRVYYTLHNDAGTCLYASPYFRDGLSTRRVRFFFGKRQPERWFMWIVGGGGPFGPRPVDDDDDWEIVDIDHEYDGETTLRLIPRQSECYWKGRNVITARYAFARTGLVKVYKNFPKVRDTQGMFCECPNLKSFHSRDFKKSKNTSHMFRDCPVLDRFCSYDSRKVFKRTKNCNYMFKGCKALPEIILSIAYATTAKEMFRDCTSLHTALLYCPNIITMDSMFDTCTNLSEFSTAKSSVINSPVNLNAVETATYAFYDCKKLSKFNCKKMLNLRDAKFMFYGCTKLNNVSTIFSSLVDGKGMFQNCTSLTTMRTDDAIQFQYLTNGKQMFANCTSLQSFKLNMPSLQDGTNMFRGCTSLTTITMTSFQNLNTGLAMFAGGVKLDKASCIDLGNELRLNKATWASVVDGQRNGIGIGVDANLKDDAEVREALGLNSTPSEPVSGLGENEEAGEITNSVQSKILTRITWN